MEAFNKAPVRKNSALLIGERSLVKAFFDLVESPRIAKTHRIKELEQKSVHA